MQTFIKNLARGAGAILKDGFKKKFKVNIKSAFYDIVTEYDLLADKYITERIAKKFPKHGILAEESGNRLRGRKNFWVIDPMDGTHAFAHGVPQFAVSIAFVSGNILRASAVYDPMNDDLFMAEKGKGATVNGKQTRVGAANILNFATIATYIKTGHENNKKNRRWIYNNVVIENEMWSDKTSSPALAGGYVGAGRFDVFISTDLNPWDYAGGALIMKEGGAKITELDGSPYRWNSNSLIGANPALHKLVMMSLKK